MLKNSAGLLSASRICIAVSLCDTIMREDGTERYLHQHLEVSVVSCQLTEVSIYFVSRNYGNYNETMSD